MSFSFDTFGMVGNRALLCRLFDRQKAYRLGHAYILEGQTGSGRHLLAKIIAAAALCESENPRPCGKCTHCKKIKSDVHPDVQYIKTSEKSIVPVAFIRNIRSDIYIAPMEGNRKIYIIEQAETMTNQGQNALLKVLEEPPEYGMIILLCQRTEALLPTILSRGVTLRLLPVSPKEGALAVMRRIPGIDMEKAQQAMETAKGYVGEAINILSKEEDSGTAEIEEQFERLVLGKSHAEFLALHTKLSQNREVFCRFADAMCRRLTIEQTKGTTMPGKGALSVEKTVSLSKILQRMREKAEKNGNLSLCSFYLLVTSWEVTH